MLHEQNELGMASPTPAHQRLIKNIIFNYENNDNPLFEILPNPPIDLTDLEAIQLDIAFYQYGAIKPNIIIEIEHLGGLTRVHNKLPIVFWGYPEVKEFFVYVYDEKEWRQYTGIGKEKYIKNSFSDLLDIDLADLIKPKPPKNNLNGFRTYL